MKTKIIGIAGLAGSGKDTVGEAIRAFGKLDRENWEIKKFATELKRIASILTGYKIQDFESQEFKNAKLGPEWGDMTVRDMLQKIGTEAMRDNLHHDVWVNALFTTYGYNSRWIITDVRFPNEIERIKQYDGILIKIVRPGIVALDHYSEKALDDFDGWDHVINNDGDRYDLVQKIRQIYYEN
jgi:hypothetical protein